MYQHEYARPYHKLKIRLHHNNCFHEYATPYHNKQVLIQTHHMHLYEHALLTRIQELMIIQTHRNHNNRLYGYAPIFQVPHKSTRHFHHNRYHRAYVPLKSRTRIAAHNTHPCANAQAAANKSKSTPHDKSHHEYVQLQNTSTPNHNTHQSAYAPEAHRLKNHLHHSNLHHGYAHSYRMIKPAHNSYQYEYAQVMNKSILTHNSQSREHDTPEYSKSGYPDNSLHHVHVPLLYRKSKQALPEPDNRHHYEHARPANKRRLREQTKKMPKHTPKKRIKYVFS